MRTVEDARFAALLEAERKAFALLDAIEDAGFIRPGRTEREVELDIRKLAKEAFGIERHWHKRIVRAGINTLATFRDNPPIQVIDEDDIVFLDIGPVFGEWEADVGRSYAIGKDPLKHALCRDLAVLFEAGRRKFERTPDISGAELYHFICNAAREAGWRFGGKIAGHIVAEFPNARIPATEADKDICPSNHRPMRQTDAFGRKRHWILEIHLVDPDGNFGGFYERLIEGDEGEPKQAELRGLRRA